MVVDTERIAATRLLIEQLEATLLLSDQAGETLIGALLCECLGHAQASLDAMLGGRHPKQ